MHEGSLPVHEKETQRRKRSEAIEEFVSQYASCGDSDLISQMMLTLCRLAADGADRGDLKILNTALRELRYAFKVFAPYSEVHKVSIFGSARTSEDHPQYLQAKKFATSISEKGWMVITGAGDGIMRAGHHGAKPAASFGVSIRLPFEQSTNSIIADDPKLVNFKYFFTRKLIFVKEAHAIVLFPGGLGTQDECFEALTLIQTSKAAPVPVVLCDEPGGTYWSRWRSYVESELLGNKMIDPTDMGLFFLTDSVDAAVTEVLGYYRTYHSSRYVGDQLVIRLNQRLPAEVVSRFDVDFADIVTTGPFEQTSGPLPDEDDAYPDKGRLVLTYNRRSAGRLRELINEINRV